MLKPAMLTNFFSHVSIFPKIYTASTGKPIAMRPVIHHMHPATVLS